jgi:hypothetical protein
MFHIVEHTEAVEFTLGEFEQLVLIAIVRLDDNPYGATIRRDIEERTERRLSISAVYTTARPSGAERLRAVMDRRADPATRRPSSKALCASTRRRACATVRI